jgi:hypothetical protein
MFITVLPKPDVNYVCAPKLNHTITFLGKISIPSIAYLHQREKSGSLGVEGGGEG